MAHWNIGPHLLCLAGSRKWAEWKAQKQRQQVVGKAIFNPLSFFFLFLSFFIYLLKHSHLYSTSFPSLTLTTARNICVWRQKPNITKITLDTLSIWRYCCLARDYMDITEARHLTKHCSWEPVCLSKLSYCKFWRSRIEKMGFQLSTCPWGLRDLPSFSYKAVIFSNSHCS